MAVVERLFWQLGMHFSGRCRCREVAIVERFKQEVMYRLSAGTKKSGRCREVSLQSRRIWGYDKGHKGYECSMPPSWMIKLKEGWGEAKKDSEGEDDGPRHAPHPPLLH